jgi:hypothetical protein
VGDENPNAHAGGSWAGGWLFSHHGASVDFPWSLQTGFRRKHNDEKRAYNFFAFGDAYIFWSPEAI